MRRLSRRRFVASLAAVALASGGGVWLRFAAGSVRAGTLVAVGSESAALVMRGGVWGIGVSSAGEGRLLEGPGGVLGIEVCECPGHRPLRGDGVLYGFHPG